MSVQTQRNNLAEGLYLRVVAILGLHDDFKEWANAEGEEVQIRHLHNIHMQCAAFAEWHFSCQLSNQAAHAHLQQYFEWFYDYFDHGVFLDAFSSYRQIANNRFLLSDTHPCCIHLSKCSTEAAETEYPGRYDYDRLGQIPRRIAATASKYHSYEFKPEDLGLEFNDIPDIINSNWINGIRYQMATPEPVPEQIKPTEPIAESSLYDWQDYFVYNFNYEESFFMRMDSEVEKAHEIYHRWKKQEEDISSYSTKTRIWTWTKVLTTPGAIAGTVLGGPVGGFLGWLGNQYISELRFRNAEKTIKLWYLENKESMTKTKPWWTPPPEYHTT